MPPNNLELLATIVVEATNLLARTKNLNRKKDTLTNKSVFFISNEKYIKLKAQYKE